MNDATDPPNGCYWCGHSRRDHLSRWGSGVGFHVYTEPTDETRKRRMIARRLNKMEPSHGNDA